MKKLFSLVLFLVVSSLAFSQTSIIGDWVRIGDGVSTKIEIDEDFDIEVEVISHPLTKTEYEGVWTILKDNAIMFFVFKTETTFYQSYTLDKKSFMSFEIILEYSFNEDGTLTIESSAPDKIPSGNYVRVLD